MATYSTDLTTLTTAESGTWTEFASPYNSAGSPGADGENFIQGTDCYSQTTGKSNGLEISIVFDYGSGLNIPVGEVIIAWCFYAVGVNLETYANGGWRFGMGNVLGAWDWYTIGGSDYGRNPYGGWVNIAIDYRSTPTGQISSGRVDTPRYFGSVPYTINEITKGTPSAMDALRYGRGEISVTGTGGSFSELSEYNDYNAGGTPPGTSSTSVDSGRHRLGLFQEAAGTYLWKGLMSLGLTATSVTFSDSNETIIIEDCPHCSADFNKIEINNSSSSVTLSNITFISTATTANGKGELEVVANATVDLLGCSFNDMSKFVFNGGTNDNNVTNCTFNSCDEITQGGALMDGCKFNTTTATTAAIISTQATFDDLGGNAPNTFTGDGTTTPGHAVDLGSISGNVTVIWNNILDNGVTNQSEWEGSTQAPTAGTLGDANDAIKVQVLSGSSLKISVAAGATIPTVYHTSSGTVEITANEVTLTIIVKDIDTGSVIEGAMVYVTNSGETATYINKVETNASGQVTYTTSLGSAQTLAGKVRAATPATKAYSKFYKSSPVAGTFSNIQDTNITIQLIPDE